MAEVDVQLREAVRVLKKLTGRIVSQGSLQALGELSEALGVAKAKVDRHYVLRASDRTVAGHKLGSLLREK